MRDFYEESRENERSTEIRLSPCPRGEDQGEGFAIFAPSTCDAEALTLPHAWQRLPASLITNLNK